MQRKWNGLKGSVGFALTLSFLGLGNAPEASAALCHSFADFGKKVKRCEDNFVLADSAMNCVDAYGNAIELGNRKIQKLLATQVSQMKEKQSGTYNTSDTSYQKVRDELNRLIAEGEAAKAAAQSMLDEIFYPEDLDNEDILGMSSEDYLATEPCFAPAKFAMENSVNLIQKMINDLRKTEVSSGIKENTSEHRSDNVQALTAPVISKAKGKSGAPNMGNRPKNSPSDLTGTQKAIEDKNKGAAIIQQQK